MQMKICNNIIMSESQVYLEKYTELKQKTAYDAPLLRMVRDTTFVQREEDNDDGHKLYIDIVKDGVKRTDQITPHRGAIALLERANEIKKDKEEIGRLSKVIGDKKQKLKEYIMNNSELIREEAKKVAREIDKCISKITLLKEEKQTPTTQAELNEANRIGLGYQDELTKLNKKLDEFNENNQVGERETEIKNIQRLVQNKNHDINDNNTYIHKIMHELRRPIARRLAFFMNIPFTESASSGRDAHYKFVNKLNQFAKAHPLLKAHIHKFASKYDMYGAITALYTVSSNKSRVPTVDNYYFNSETRNKVNQYKEVKKTYSRGMIFKKEITSSHRQQIEDLDLILDDFGWLMCEMFHKNFPKN